MTIGNTVIMVGGGHKNLDTFDCVNDENVTSELVVRPRNSKPVSVETRKSLNNITKQKICDLAAERFGASLKMQTEKKELITEFLKLQQLEFQI